MELKSLTKEAPARRGLRLLIVEDSTDLGLMLRAFLESLGHQGCLVKDMASALRAAQQGTFDMLLCDILLPDGNGCDLLRQLTARGCLPPVALAMSCYSQRRDVVTSEAAGFAKHLMKPFLPGVLEGVLTEYAHQAAETSGSSKAMPDLPPTLRSSSAKAPRIIVVDGRESGLQLVVNLVRETLPAAEIVATETGLEALHAFEQGGADFLVTNHQMPGTDGATLIRRVRAQQPTLPIVMISLELGARSTSTAAGADWFLNETEVVERLPELLCAQLG